MQYIWIKPGIMTTFHTLTDPSIENDPNLIVYKSIDHAYLVEKNDKVGIRMMQERLKHCDVMFNKTNIIGSPDNIIMPSTWLKETVNMSTGEKYYSFGSLFGKNSILLGARFTDFMKSIHFNQMLNRKLETVVFNSRPYDGQFILESYQFR